MKNKLTQRILMLILNTVFTKRDNGLVCRHLQLSSQHLTQCKLSPLFDTVQKPRTLRIHVACCVNRTVFLCILLFTDTGNEHFHVITTVHISVYITSHQLKDTAENVKLLFICKWVGLGLGQYGRTCKLLCNTLCGFNQ